MSHTLTFRELRGWLMIQFEQRPEIPNMNFASQLEFQNLVCDNRWSPSSVCYFRLLDETA